MIIEVKGYDVDSSLMERIKQRLLFLNKYFAISEDDRVLVLVKERNTALEVEITVCIKDLMLRNELIHDDFYAAFDIALMKMEDKIKSQQKQLSIGHSELLNVAFCDRQAKALEVDPCAQIMEIEELSLEEAIMRMELLARQFYVYKDIETKNLAVVYKRNDGSYGFFIFV